MMVSNDIEGSMLSLTRADLKYSVIVSPISQSAISRGVCGSAAAFGTLIHSSEGYESSFVIEDTNVLASFSFVISRGFLGSIAIMATSTSVSSRQFITSLKLALSGHVEGSMPPLTGDGARHSAIVPQTSQHLKSLGLCGSASYLQTFVHALDAYKNSLVIEHTASHFDSVLSGSDRQNLNSDLQEVTCRFGLSNDLPESGPFDLARFGGSDQDSQSTGLPRSNHMPRWTLFASPPEFVNSIVMSRSCYKWTIRAFPSLEFVDSALMASPPWAIMTDAGLSASRPSLAVRTIVGWAFSIVVLGIIVALLTLWMITRTHNQANEPSEFMYAVTELDDEMNAEQLSTSHAKMDFSHPQQSFGAFMTDELAGVWLQPFNGDIYRSDAEEGFLL
jgi:hypothetical protein